MTSEIELNRVIPLEAIDALRAAIDTAIGSAKCGGLAVRKGRYYLIFESGVSPEDQNAALQLALSFDTSTRTPEQLQDASDKSDLQTMLNQADTAIDAITAELVVIAADVSSLTAATTLAQVKPIVQNMLDRQAATDIRQRAIIRALKRMRRIL